MIQSRIGTGSLYLARWSMECGQVSSFSISGQTPLDSSRSRMSSLPVAFKNCFNESIATLSREKNRESWIHIYSTHLTTEVKCISMHATISKLSEIKKTD